VPTEEEEEEEEEEVGQNSSVGTVPWLRMHGA
jgi:hypothetical protein